MHFTNSVNPTEFELMAVTAQNVEAIKAKYGIDLSDILWEKGEENDVKLVVVKKTAAGYSFVDMEGNELKSPTKDSIVYTSLSKSETLLQETSGKTRYNEKELPSDPTEAKKVLEAIQKEFTKFRSDLLASKDIFTYKITGVSTIVPEKASLVGTLIIGTKGSTVTDHNDKDVNVPVGRPIVVTKAGAKTQFADNHLLSQKKLEDVFNIIRLLAKKINAATEEDFEKDKKIIDTKLTRYLKSVLYWRNPDVSKQETPSNNQIWISFDFEFGGILNIGGEKFVLSSIEENLDGLQVILSKVWHILGVLKP